MEFNDCVTNEKTWQANSRDANEDGTAGQHEVGRLKRKGQKMHFAVAVVTQEKPTDRSLADVLAPFGPAEGAAGIWDWYALADDSAVISFRII
jgi:hypothetical protein